MPTHRLICDRALLLCLQVMTYNTGLFIAVLIGGERMDNSSLPNAFGSTGCGIAGPAALRESDATFYLPSSA